MTSFYTKTFKLGFPNGSVGKESACNAGDARDVGLIPGSGISPVRGNGNNPLQYFCLKNPTDRGAWQAAIQRIAKSWVRLIMSHFGMAIWLKSSRNFCFGLLKQKQLAEKKE